MVGQNGGPPQSLSQVIWGWLMGPLILRMERTMAQGFEDLQAAVDAISGEGGELAQMRDAVLDAIAALQGHVTTLQQSADALQAQFDAAGMTAGAQATALQDTKSQLDAVEQALNDAASAANPPPAEPVPTP